MSYRHVPSEWHRLTHFHRNLRRQHFINVSVWLNEKGGKSERAKELRQTKSTYDEN